MLKLFKYLYLANLYKSAKKSFIMLFVYLISLVLIVFIINDIISVSTTASVYFFILIKWVATVVLLVLIVLTLIKIIDTALNPISGGKTLKKEDPKKKRILAKEKLTSKSDTILRKYMKTEE